MTDHKFSSPAAAEAFADAGLAEREAVPRAWITRIRRQLDDLKAKNGAGEDTPAPPGPASPLSPSTTIGPALGSFIGRPANPTEANPTEEEPQ